MDNLTDRVSINNQDRVTISKHPKEGSLLKGAVKTSLGCAQFEMNCDHTCLCDAVFCVQAPGVRGHFWLSPCRTTAKYRIVLDFSVALKW